MPIHLYAHLWTASSSLWLKGAAKDGKVGKMIDRNGSSEGRRGGRVGGLSHRTEVLEQCPRKVAHVLMGYTDTHTHMNMHREKMMAIWMSCDSL